MTYLFTLLVLTATVACMRLFGFSLTRTPREVPIVRQRATSSEGDPALLERLNQLETTVERLELDNTERQLAVLNVVEKIQHQLRARERKRERDAEPEELVDGSDNRGPVLAGAVRDPSSISPLTRFRRF